jgi:acyl carrier protein
MWQVHHKEREVPVGADDAGSSDEASMANRTPSPPPPLTSRWVQLRPVTPADYGFLYEMATSPIQGYRWRFRAGQPLFDDFVRTIGQGVLVQFLIMSADGKRRLGLVVCYRADFRNRNAYIALQAVSDAMGQGWVLNAGALFMNYLFSWYEFEKLYAESPEFVISSFLSGVGGDFVQEACFKDHERYMGRAWNSYVFAYYRSTWEHNAATGKLQLHVEENGVVQHRSPLSFEEFVSRLELELDLQTGSLSEDARFQADLDFDSIRMLELLCAIEDFGVILEEQALVEIKTVGDAFFHYIQRTKE